MKMKDFSKPILVKENFYPEFFFHVLHTATGKNRYHVSVTGPSQENIFFTIEKDRNGWWKIIDAPKLPRWILSIEKLLVEAIVENLAD
jgi:hypothetical protein